MTSLRFGASGALHTNCFMKPLSILMPLWLAQLGAAGAAAYVPVAGSSTLWTPMVGNFDYQADQQTGQAEADIVGGTGINHGFLVAFHGNDTVSSIDGTLAFRVRLDAADGPPNAPQYTGLLWVGIDGDTDGDIDLFVGANMQGSASSNAIELRNPGSDLNISPSTTSISSSAYKSYSLDTIEDATRANYNYRPVDFATDGGNTNDLTQATSGDPDYYLSFMVPFADIVEYLGSLPNPIQIDDATTLRFVVATARQSNRLNQDIGGLPKNFDDTQTWENLGGFTPPYTPVPEPSGILVLGSLATGCLLRRRRR